MFPVLTFILCLLVAFGLGYVACLLHTSILYALRVMDPPGSFGTRRDTDAIIRTIHETPHTVHDRITVTRKESTE